MRPAQLQHPRKTGPDSSTQPGEVFGVNINRFVEMDEIMLPLDTPQGEADDYYDCASDILALPGGYKSWDRTDEDESMAAAMYAMAQGARQVHLHGRFGAKKNNALGQIKATTDLPEFIENVTETHESAEEVMTSQLTRQMFSAGHDQDSIEDYLTNGVLPRVVRDTYKYYLQFLTVLTGYVNKAPSGQPWEDTVAHLLLKHHAEKLGLIRETSATYRDMVLRNYTYLREQGRTNFWNEKLSRKAVMHSATLANQPASSSKKSQEGTSADKCPTCNRKHSGQNPCPTALLTPAERTTLGRSLGQRAYEKALRKLKQLFSTNPNTDHSEAIETARQHAAS